MQFTHRLDENDPQSMLLNKITMILQHRTVVYMQITLYSTHTQDMSSPEIGTKIIIIKTLYNNESDNNSLILSPGNDLRSPTQTSRRHHTRRGRRRVVRIERLKVGCQDREEYGGSRNRGQEGSKRECKKERQYFKRGREAG